jgi:hypothetical protein
LVCMVYTTDEQIHVSVVVVKWIAERISIPPIHRFIYQFYSMNI